MAGCVKFAYKNWAQLTSDPEILETISGMPISLIGALPPSCSVEYPFGKTETEFIAQEIVRLLHKRVIAETTHENGEFISPIFVRPKSDGGFRLILNLKRLNEVAPYNKFKMETLSTILCLIRKDVFMCKIDIKDAYYSIPIKDCDQKLLKFQYKGTLYKFTALPNGYTEGPRKFTKALKPPLATLRKNNVTIAGYFDDMITVSSTMEKSVCDITQTISLFDSLGFVIHPVKSIFLPSQTMEFLGFIIDSNNMTVSMTTGKKQNIIDHCNKNLNNPNHSIRNIATLLGKFSSALIAVPMGKLHFKALERNKVASLRKNCGNFDITIHLGQAAKNDILWWRDSIMPSYAPIVRENPSHVVTTDASSYGWGAVYKNETTGGSFSFEECALHINILELRAVLFGLMSLCGSLNATHILVKVDNTSAVAAINKMGSTRSTQMDSEVHNIWNWASSKNIWLTATHIPGIQNYIADAESRKNETHTEWMLNRHIFAQVLQELSFTPDIDLFASRLNNQLPTFVSYRPDPAAQAVNAFTITWENTKFYAFPPFACIPRVLQKIWSDKASGILIVPDWPNQPWYSQFTQMVVRDVSLLPREDLLHLLTSHSQHPLRQHLQLRAALVCGQQ